MRGKFKEKMISLEVNRKNKRSPKVRTRKCLRVILLFRRMLRISRSWFNQRPIDHLTWGASAGRGAWSCTATVWKMALNALMSASIYPLTTPVTMTWLSKVSNSEKGTARSKRRTQREHFASARKTIAKPTTACVDSRAGAVLMHVSVSARIITAKMGAQSAITISSFSPKTFLKSWKMCSDGLSNCPKQPFNGSKDSLEDILIKFLV